MTEAAARLHIALAPLAAFPAKVRAILESVGLASEGISLRDALLDLLENATSGGLTDALVALVSAARDKVLGALDVIVNAGKAAIDDVQGLIDLLDLSPIINELTALQAQVHDEVAQLTPDALLGDVLDSARQVVQRLGDFDPLAPVSQVITEAVNAADAVFESARPTVVFAPVVTLHHNVVGLASGLDVVTLLRPILDALDGIARQLDDGFDRTGDALKKLQDSLPSHVEESGVGASIDVGVSL